MTLKVICLQDGWCVCQSFERLRHSGGQSSELLRLIEFMLGFLCSTAAASAAMAVGGGVANSLMLAFI